MNSNIAMTYRALGQSQLQVSRLCLGTMMFGDQTSEAESLNISAAARAQGMNFIDTADVYMNGASETITGKAIRAERDWWVLATKLGNDMNRPTSKATEGSSSPALPPNPNRARYSRKWVEQACSDSLKRLGTDYIDVYYMHRDYDQDSLVEPIQAMGDLIRAGKIRYFGLSNFRAWRIAEVVSLCKQMGVPQPIVCQPYYNALNRLPEVEVLPACGYHGIGVVPYSPVARGILSGKYLPGQEPPSDSRVARADKRMMQTEWRPESLEIAQSMMQYAHQRGVSLVQFATAWVLANQFITSVIVGPKTRVQFDEYFGAIPFAWSQDDEDFVNSLVPEGHPSTPGYHDPAYPFVGR